MEWGGGLDPYLYKESGNKREGLRKGGNDYKHGPLGVRTSSTWLFSRMGTLLSELQ
jgi:hypothetical protein